MGVPKPPFDYRCHYWSPFFHFDGDACKDAMQANEEVAATRKKRTTKTIESVTVNGVEAVTLCATSDRIDEGSDNFEIRDVALPTNEASQLRCINWVLCKKKNYKINEIFLSSHELIEHLCNVI